MRAFWPPGEAAQADYETLRAAVVAGTPPADAVAVRFALGGLSALIARPSAEPIFVGVLLGARRPAWTPHADPRLDALAACYGLLVADPNAEGLSAGADRPDLIVSGGS